MNTNSSVSVLFIFSKLFTNQFEALFIGATVHHNIENSAAHRLNQNTHDIRIPIGGAEKVNRSYWWIT